MLATDEHPAAVLLEGNRLVIETLDVAPMWYCNPCSEYVPAAPRSTLVTIPTNNLAPSVTVVLRVAYERWGDYRPIDDISVTEGVGTYRYQGI